MILAIWAYCGAARGQGTAFTYQGLLYDGVKPASGAYDLRFSLYNADTGGAQVGSTQPHSGTLVSNGLFTVSLDFGAVFTGNDEWLQIDARTNGASVFVPLEPRQPLTPMPYALYAEGANAANLSGGVADTKLPSNVALRAGGNIFSGAQAIAGSASLEFGHGDAKQADAGKIGYEESSSDSLDIVGAGLDGTSRKVRMYAEGGVNLNGPLQLNGSTILNNNAGADQIQFQHGRHSHYKAVAVRLCLWTFARGALALA